MTEELEKRIDDEKFEHLITRIREAHEEGVLKIRDWMAMYEILIDACEREQAAAMEQYIMHSLEQEGDEQ